MAHIVYITNGMASTLHSGLELGRRLHAAGHRVTFLSHADVGRQVEADGFPFVALTADRRFTERAQLSPRPSGPLAALGRHSERRRIRRESIANDEIEATVTGLRPDLLLIDIELHFAIIATAHLGLPTLLPIVWFSIFRRPGLPPLSTALPPPSSARERLDVRISWWRLRLSSIRHEWRLKLDRLRRAAHLEPVAYDTFSTADLADLARSRGFDYRAETDRTQWLRPHLYRRLPVLCYNAREMELPHDPAPTLHYVGPMVQHGRADVRAAGDAGRRWREYRAERAAAPSPRRPLIYASLGTFWSADRAFLRRVLDVFARRPEWDLVLGLGGTLAADELEPIPDNALILDWAPQVEVLEEADLAITHGGITTINECIESGVPMLVYSTHHVDQDGCAARVAHHGLGRVGDKEFDDVEALDRRLEAALADASLRTNVATMRRHFDAYRQSNQAVAIIERTIASSPPIASGHHA